jgi:hypothetical protein
MTIPIVEVAPSTTAASAAGVLSLHGASDAERIHEMLKRYGFHVTREALAQALGEAVERGRITQDGQIYASTLPAGHIVRSRPESDPTGWTWNTEPARAGEAR